MNRADVLARMEAAQKTTPGDMGAMTLPKPEVVALCSALLAAWDVVEQARALVAAATPGLRKCCTCPTCEDDESTEPPHEGRVLAWSIDRDALARVLDGVPARPRTETDPDDIARGHDGDPLVDSGGGRGAESGGPR